MAKIKEIKRRIKSVQSTKKITRAMELVAAVKMKKAQDKATGTRAYAAKAWEIMTDAVAKIEEKDHFLLRAQGHAKDIMIVVSSDRGLCGGLNGNLFRAIEKFLAENTGREFRYIVIGKTGADYVRRSKKDILAAFGRLDNLPHIVEVRPAVKILFDEIGAGNASRAFLAFNQFVSSTSQVPHIMQVFPIQKNEAMRVEGEDAAVEMKDRRFAFEPSPVSVLESLLPRLTEMQVYQAVLESNASEHSARMMAMHNATKNSEELLGDLVSHYNQSRQQSITQEISEISSAAEAMR